jgi:sec-independent protein translocase protein TatA
MLKNIGIMELVVLLVIVLLLFGPKRLGDIGTGLGKGISNFKKSLKGEDPNAVDVTPKDADKIAANGKVADKA